MYIYICVSIYVYAFVWEFAVSAAGIAATCFVLPKCYRVHCLYKYMWIYVYIFIHRIHIYIYGICPPRRQNCCDLLRTAKLLQRTLHIYVHMWLLQGVIHIYIHTYICVCVCIYIYTCICVIIYVHMITVPCFSMRIYTYKHICKFIHCFYMRIYICKHIYKYTHDYLPRIFLLICYRKCYFLSVDR